jgi:hypothetical protein
MSAVEPLRAQAFGMSQSTHNRPVRVVCVTSGKGGVGKTNISVNLALALSLQNQSVMLLDADLGLANVDVILGLAPALQSVPRHQPGTDPGGNHRHRPERHPDHSGQFRSQAHGGADAGGKRRSGRRLQRAERLGGHHADRLRRRHLRQRGHLQPGLPRRHRGGLRRAGLDHRRLRPDQAAQPGLRHGPVPDPRQPGRHRPGRPRAVQQAGPGLRPILWT